MNRYLELFKHDKLKNCVIIFWLVTVFSSFWGSYLFPIEIPSIGTLFLFRIMLPFTIILYIYWMIKTKESLIKGISPIEKWCYILILSMFIYSIISLFRAIDFLWTFRRLFNLCFCLCFFFLFLRLCKDKNVLKKTLQICLLNINIMLLLGLFEVFFYRIFFIRENDYRYYQFFSIRLWSPIVTSGNENDYSSMLLFILTVCLIYFLKHKDIVLFKDRKLTGNIIFIDFCMSYFLCQAANARLVNMSIYHLFIGIIIYSVITERKKEIIALPILLVVVVGLTSFSHNYLIIKDTINIKYIEISNNILKSDKCECNYSDTIEKLKNDIDNNKKTKESFTDQLYSVDEETGEKEIRDDASVGIRAKLLMRALKFIPESYGLGIGVGNSEKIIEREGTIGGMTNIHCFIARIIAEYGIFVIIPLSVIGVLIFKNIIINIILAIRSKNRDKIAIQLLFLFILFTYPFLSTASSDAQNQISMWVYLGGVASFY